MSGLGAGLGGVVFTLLLGAVWLYTWGPLRAVTVGTDAEIPGLPPLDREAWDDQRLAWLSELDRTIYGPPPPDVEARLVERRALSGLEIEHVSVVEEWRVEIGERSPFQLILVLPRAASPVPVILIQIFCGNRAAMPGRPSAVAAPLHGTPISCRPVLAPVARLVFGRYINAPPIAEIAARGYGVALLYGGDVVPDRADDARTALAALAPAEGAVSAWAWTYSRAADVLIADPRIDAGRLALFGQSRQGKAALLAGARDDRFAAVIALQAGLGGDALTRHRRGESVEHAVSRYPHWFAPAFGRFAHADPPVDQDRLLAAIAPRRLLLGHARRDAWSDPAGAWLAAQSAQSAYAALGAPAPEFYLRSGRHGVTAEDWRRTLNFLGRIFARAD